MPIRSAPALRNKLGLTPLGERVLLTVKRKGLSQKLLVEMTATALHKAVQLTGPPSFSLEPARLVI